VVVAEDLSAVAGPDSVPDGGRVYADAVDEPLGVVVESDLGRCVSMVRVIVKRNARRLCKSRLEHRDGGWRLALQ
jgi:hypothetical protein